MSPDRCVRDRALVWDIIISVYQLSDLGAGLQDYQPALKSLDSRA